MRVEELPLEYDASGGQIWKHTRKSKKLIVQCCVSTMGAGARFPRRKNKNGVSFPREFPCRLFPSSILGDEVSNCE